LSEDKSPEVATPGNIPLRSQLPVYAAGIFSNGAIQLAAVVVPLWMLHVDSSPLMVGIALGSRQILPVLLSIHGGALMDRIGIRKVMIWFSILGAVTPFLFPLFPFFAAVILLQMLGGISAAMGWIGTQAHPEFKSRPDRPAPLFQAFVGAALERAAGRNPQLIPVDVEAAG